MLRKILSWFRPRKQIERKPIKECLRYWHYPRVSPPPSEKLCTEIHHTQFAEIGWTAVEYYKELDLYKKSFEYDILYDRVPPPKVAVSPREFFNLNPY